MSQPRITIVTPCYNSERYLEETILSVLAQDYDNLEYIIIDGGSTDGTVEIIRKYEQHLACWASEPDKGMYDAINKGFSKATGEIYAWINSDDTYLPGAFHVMVEAFLRYPEWRWFTGASSYVDELGDIVHVGDLQLYQRSNLEKGYHGLLLPFVQQNCCFWRAGLWREVRPIPADFKYAGDYWLWLQFAKHAELVSLNLPVASFRRHGSQLSLNLKLYYDEVFDAIGWPKLSACLRRWIRRLYRGWLHVRNALVMDFSRSSYYWIEPSSDYRVLETRKSVVPRD